MSILRIISVTVPVTDPITIAVQGGETQMLQKLVDIYEGRCFYGYKILKVRHIIKMDAAVVSTLSLATVPVSFTAETISYAPGDTIVGFRIMNVLSGFHYGTFDHGRVSTAIDPNLPVGDAETLHISTVISAEYPMTSPDITLRVCFYRHPTTFTVWKCDDNYEEVDQASEISGHIAAIRAEIDTFDKDTVEFFKKLFYPWKTQQNKPHGATEYDLVDLSRKTKLPTYLCLDPRSGMFSGKVYGYADNKYPDDYIIGDGVSGVDVVISLLAEYLKKLYTLRDAAVKFNAAKRNSPGQLTIWRAIEGTKR